MGESLSGEAIFSRVERLPPLVEAGNGFELSDHGKALLGFIRERAGDWFRPPTEAAPPLIAREDIDRVFDENAGREGFMPVLEAMQEVLRSGMLGLSPSGATAERLCRKVGQVLGVSDGIDMRNLSRFEGDLRALCLSFEELK